MFLGLRSHIITTADLDAARSWYSEALGIEPYFDEPFYVGFDVGGFELGLLPDQPADYPAGGLAYWGVTDVVAARDRLIAAGATLESDVRDVGENILMAVVADPAGNRIGIIENPHFSIRPS